jgi:hypothetical protein
VPQPLAITLHQTEVSPQQHASEILALTTLKVHARSVGAS